MVGRESYIYKHGPLTPIFCLGFCRYDHQERLSAKEASAHPYFAPVRQAAARGGSPGTIGFPV